MDKRSKTQRRRNFKSKSFKPKDDFESTNKKESCNDPSWYIREGQLAKDVASFSFNTPLGKPADIEPDGASVTGVLGKQINVPGIMRIHTIPAVGYSRNGASPINLAAKNLYSWVRHANSGHANYDSPDMMLYLVAMDSMYAMIWHLMRAYGTARVYSQRNRYIGDALLTAMGFYPDQVRENLADFRAYINMLIVKVSAFCTPTSMSLFKRHTWMYSGVFKDEDVEKAQMYLYVPTLLYQYNENSGAGKCDPVSVLVDGVGDSNGAFVSVTNSLSAWRAIANGMINALVASEDIAIMSGDIRKAYGENNLWQIALIPEDYTVSPIYSGEILDQIHNTIFTGSRPRHVIDPTDVGQLTGYDITDLTIYQDISDPLQPIKLHPVFGSGVESCMEHFCDMEENEPSPERILVGTRNMIHGTTQQYMAGANWYWITEIDSFGSDLCLYAQMYSYSSGGTLNISDVYTDFRNYIDVGLYTKFHKAPLHYRFDYDSGLQSVVLTEVIGELGDYIVMDKTDIDKMHESAILSMLGVPV